jgi:hypothetical protein
MKMRSDKKMYRCFSNLYERTIKMKNNKNKEGNPAKDIIWGIIWLLLPLLILYLLFQ